MKISYRNIPSSSMSLEDIEGCALLFSRNYGIWAKPVGNRQAGENVVLSASLMRKMFVEKPDRFVSMMYDDGKLIGHAFYLKRPSPMHPDRKILFVLQLVVDKGYRGNRFGLTLLQSIFGLSDCDAWGLFTSNPLTIKALEDATFRKASVRLIEKHLNELKKPLSDVFENDKWLDTFHAGCVDTNFPVDHSQNDRKFAKAYPHGGFPFKKRLGVGEEWLAMIFKSQRPIADMDSIRNLTKTSWTILQDAYSRMNVEDQRWASFAREEVDYLFRNEYVRSGDSVLDLGCGTGRHAVELAKRGCHVVGVDFSQGMLDKALENAKGIENVEFLAKDIREWRPDRQFDVVLCLYDVIGSSIEDADAKLVLDLMTASLKNGGIAVASVMNLELTRKLCSRKANRFSDMSKKEDFVKLMNLPPSCTMKDSGDVFKGQLILLNHKTGVAYRREQFLGENELQTEYVIPDRRYTRGMFRNLFRGYEELSLKCVCAGCWDKNLPPQGLHSKEILGVFRKQGALTGLLKTITI